MKEYVCRDENETVVLAHSIAEKLEPGDVICLAGELGSGKTFFARSLIRMFLPEEDVPSPTFTLVQTYDTPKGTMFHFDLYRLEEAEEVYELGLEDALSGGISFIEWSEKVKHLLPPRKLSEISIEIAGETSRKIKVSGLLEERL